MAERDIHQGALAGVRWRDEILQLMYWMTGEGFGREFAVADLQKFLPADAEVLAENLGLLADGGLIERAGEKYALTDVGRREGGRRFADEFEEMLRPGHFECDEPDCGCHNPGSVGGICKHLSPPA